jgi:hypothetical protein
MQPAEVVSQDYDALISGNRCSLQLPPELKASAQTSQDNAALLPPPFGAGYIFPPNDTLSPFDQHGSRVIFSVDSRCEPYNLIRRDVVDRANLQPFAFRTRLALGDLGSVVESEEMVVLQLRIVINDRPRLFTIRCVVWPTLAGELIISNKTALAYGLTIFCHSPELREAIIGREALSSGDEFDSVGDVPSSVATIIGADDDQHIMESISPIESLRQAMLKHDVAEDAWVNEELRGPLAGVFGPLPPEPARVPPLEFDVDEEALRMRTYGNTQPVRLPVSSPHGQDVIDAQWDELKNYNVLVEAYPDIGPGPIANIAFTVAKPGVTRVKRPIGFQRNVIPADPALAKEHAAYAASLTADRVVVNFTINEFITVQHFAMPSVQENLVKLSKYKYWSKIDIVKAYWGIPVHPRCWKWLYTIAPGGKAGYWIRAPMGVAPICVWFQYCIQGVLRRESAFVLCYADDIMIGANEMTELRNRIRIVLQRLYDVGFRLNPKKCQLCPSDVIHYLGWILRDGKIYPGENTISKLASVLKPVDLPPKYDDKAKRQLVRRFLGLILYLGAHIPFHAEQLRPLHDLTRTKDSATDPVSIAQRALATTKKKTKIARKFVWNSEADAAWNWAIDRLRAIKPLYAPTYAPDTWLATYTDASNKGWGGLLVEYRKGDSRPYIISCVSGAFVDGQLKWSTNAKECYGLYKSVSKFRVYLHLHQFVINVDHRNLIWMSVSANDMIVRMATALQQYRYLVKHCSGDVNVAADILSRSFPDPDVLPSHDMKKLTAELTDTEETMPPSDFVDQETSDSDTVAPPIDGSVMPVSRALSPPPPILPHQRHADPPSRRQRRPRVRRQPDAPLQPHPDAIDDGLPIFDVGPFPPPPPHRIPAEHYHIIKSFHGGTNPHTGVDPLLAALHQQGYNWPGIDEDVRHFVATCHACQLERLRRRGPSSLPYRTILIPTRMFDVWSFDILGPLEPCCLTGSRWIHIGIEETSKLVMLGHCVAASSMELVFFFMDCFRIFGLPRTIRSDLGPQFLSRACAEFTKATGIQHEFGIADRHESDGVVENAAGLVWPYLRLAAYDLRKYEVWTPLLCNVQLACNALARDVLGGASASELVFNRKVKPMRFLRPESMPRVGEDDPDTFAVSSFIADQASMQLHALHRADNERHMRYRHHMDAALDKADGLEHLDWVRTGILVSIPQRDHQTFSRPNKWALLRRGPYEVVSVEPGHSMVSLVDVNARFRQDAERSRPFLYPKVWLHPYTHDTQQHDSQPAPPAEPSDLPAFSLLIEPDVVGAVLEAIPLTHRIIQDTPLHVRNFEYRVRWAGQPHSANTVEPYLLIWHTSAFAEFIQGSGLLGHVPPTAYALKHRHHVNQLLHHQAPDRAVALVDPTALHAGRPLANYMPQGHATGPVQHNLESQIAINSQ